MNPANSQQALPPIDYYQVVEDVLAPEDVHDANTISEATATNGLFVVLSILVTLAHGFNLWLFLNSGMWPIIPVIIHLIISVVAIVITYGQYKKGLDVQHM